MQNKTAIDRFTLGHAMVGFLLGLWGMKTWQAGTAAVAFEGVENYVLKPAFPQLFPVGEPDSLANAAVDVAAWMGGFALAKAIYRGYPAPLWE